MKMFEKVNKNHPDKVADRIAGAIVDLAYKRDERPTVAVEVLIGHGLCTVIIESSEIFTEDDIMPIVERIDGKQELRLVSKLQDKHLANNQRDEYRCGDNGIFKGVPVTDEEKTLSKLAREIYEKYPTDGKFILDNGQLTICQSNANSDELQELFPNAIVNPLGDWTGGTTVDTGCTNRKLGSDMAQSVTGGGINAKDCSKADVSVNIYAFLKAQATGETVELSCAIGDDEVDGLPYGEIVKIAHDYIKSVGGFEKFAEWGLVR